jgi:DNA-binding IclR family transcriptional regulator
MNSADRLLTILVLFSEERPAWAADQMMAETGFTRPTLYRYLKTLCSAGLIVSTPGAGYTLGPRVTELDYLMRRADPLIAAGRDSLVALAALHPCSAFLVRWYNQRILCVASEVSAPNPRSSYPRGRPMPLARGAISRALLAFLSKREQEQIGDANLTEFARTGTGLPSRMARSRPAWSGSLRRSLTEARPPSRPSASRRRKIRSRRTRLQCWPAVSAILPNRFQHS